MDVRNGEMDVDSVSHNSDFSFFLIKRVPFFCSHHKELDNSFALML